MKRPRFRWLVSGGLALLMVLVAVASWGQTLGRGNASRASAQAGMHLAMDADPANGTRPCDPVDATATAAVDSTYTVAVCLADYTANQVESFDLRINDDQSLAFAPDPQGSEEPQNGGSGPDCVSAGCLDDNPDANDGADSAGLKLGSGWDCTGMNIVAPRSETLPIWLVCNASITSPDKELSANPGLLATITFQAKSAGSDTLSFTSATAIGMTDPAPSGSCGDVQEEKIDCLGATINIGGAVAATSTPSGGATPTSTPSGTVPGLTPTPLPPGMEAVDLVAGCNPIAATWADGTAIATVAGAVGPAGALEAIWKFAPATGAWQGFSPSVPAEVNDLTSVNRLDAIFVCVNAAATIGRPTI
jgi:hypothetical protein